MKNLIGFVILVLSLNSWSSETHSGVPAEKALTWLTNGNKRFTSQKMRSDGASPSDISRLSLGQKPHAIVLSCSDSRVPPELVFDQKLGELFVVRTAGQALDDNAIGSIEYAVEHLGANLIVVMGHTSCGAVTAAHSTLDGKSAGTPALDNLVKDIHPRIASFKGKSASPQVEKESWANVDGVTKDLVNRSSLIHDRWSSGSLWIVPSLYNLKDGAVAFHAKYSPSGASESQRKPTHSH